MKKLSILALGICALILVACGPSNPQEMDEVVRQFQYVQDPNTRLCFARYSSEGGYSNVMYTHVPCTNKVTDRLYNPQLPEIQKYKIED